MINTVDNVCDLVAMVTQSKFLFHCLSLFRPVNILKSTINEFFTPEFKAYETLR